MRMNRALVVALVVGGTAASIGAQSITGWRTPGGKLYYGDNPPRGSRQIGTTYTPPPMNTPSSKTPPANDVAAVPPASPAPPSKPIGAEPTDRDIRGTWAGMTEAQQGSRPQDPPPGWR
jgi:hypothetical protein